MTTVETDVPPIDPRIRARRIAVQRDAGRRRLARLIDVGIVLAVALGFVAALYTPLLDVDAVEVAGTARLTAAEVVAAAGIDRGTPLVQVDLGAAGARVAALPWVASARLHRGIDGTITVEVVERTPVAVVSRDGEALLVDEEGRVLGPAAPEEAADLVALEVDAVPAPGEHLPVQTADALSVAAALAQRAPGAVVRLDPESLEAELAVGGRAALGDRTALGEKVRSLVTVLDQVDLTCLDLIDVRVPSTPVLTREEGCS